MYKKTDLLYLSIIFICFIVISFSQLEVVKWRNRSLKALELYYQALYTPDSKEKLEIIK